MEGILISELKEKKIIDGSEVIPVENKNKNYNINIYNLKNFINDIEITDYNFNYKFSFDSDVTKCNVLFTNNSHKEDNIFANATVVQFNNVKE
jgi:hypothetical protein